MFDDAIKALYTKIQGDLSTASPEELAYLGTALEKIGGRATLIDVMKEGADQISLINSAKENALSELGDGLDLRKQEFDTEINETITITQAELNNVVTNAENDIDSVIDTKITELTDNINNVYDKVQLSKTEVEEASENLSESAAIANQQAINGSFFNLYFYGSL